MSIRKRLFLSNAAMILMPIGVIIIILFLINVVINGGHEVNGNRWHGPEPQNTELMNDLTKTASLEQEKLLDTQYLKSLVEKSSDGNLKIVIRKGNELIQTTEHVQDISSKELPNFGNEGYDPAGIRLREEHYSVRQHDFYFNDGTKGSIFVLNNSASFVTFARTFFPILFISLLLLLILTNVLLSYFMSRSILRPVNQLAAAAQKIKTGYLDFSIKPKRKDELGKLVQSFDDMRSQLKESLELRDRYENNRKELIANISHDLKTPITSILGYVEGIQDGVANTLTKQERYLDTIHGKATYMNRLIEELALYSKLDVKKLPFHFDKVNIKAFVRDYLEEIEDELNEKGIQLAIDTGDTQANVLLDRDKIIRVMENIIYNSVKYTDKDTCIINVSLVDKGNFIEMVLTDNGPGVSEENLSTIFTRFYQTDPSRKSGGSGLGLAIAAQIVEAHGGTIWAESKPNKGLSIHFTLKKYEGDNHE
ncbi:sensor histidine kinase [Virgibacillus ndiopensis]|uniref:sensor histidine kinase n=1 Tax=Virgibacillus ndiopensis TaxID=2004408 RepID=UPI000C086BB5|nr:HAMP domain-containing sensor histidine kinase [Virgibacillus ndiopensis]